MKKFILSVLFLFSFVFCFAKTEKGYECEKEFIAPDNSSVHLGVSEISKDATSRTSMPDYNYALIVEGFDSDASQHFLTLIYYKDKASALKEYTAALKSYNKKAKSFDESVEYYSDEKNGFQTTLTIDEDRNIPFFIFLAKGE